MGQDLGACMGQDLGYLRRVRPRCLHGIMREFLYRAKLDVLARDKAWVVHGARFKVLVWDKA